MYAPNTIKGGSNSFQQFVDVCEVTFCVITLMFFGAPHTHVAKQPKTFVFYEHPCRTECKWLSHKRHLQYLVTLVSKIHRYTTRAGGKSA